jgi:two-component system, OmpR family, KDP operon response regulator KdpE
MTRILVVDDEPQILRALNTNLRARDYDVDLSPTGEAALQLAARKHPDLVILDLGLPGIDGVEVIRGLRGWTSVPIIVLSVREWATASSATPERGQLPSRPAVSAGAFCRRDRRMKGSARAEMPAPSRYEPA